MNSKLLLFALAALSAGFGLTWAEDDAKPAGEGKARPERPARPEGEARPDGKGRPPRSDGEGPPRPEGKGRPPGPEGEGRPGGPGNFLKQIDTNADGQITKEEAGERWERLSRLDKNEDGIIGKEELAAMAGGRPGGPGGPGGEGRPGAGGQQMFERADKNGDGKLSKDELPEEAWARLSKADKDGDNAVSREEIGAMMREGGMRPGGPGGPEGAGGGGGGRLFEMSDKNKDGKLTAEELGERWEQMSRMDKNNDGAITKDEIPQMGQGRGPGGGRPGAAGGGGAGGGGAGGGAIFGQYDKDGDEKLSKAEVPEELWARITKADKNADGLVSKEELSAIYSGGPGNGGTAPGRERPRPDGEGAGVPKKARPDKA